MGDCLVNTAEDKRQDFLEFCQRYGMIAGIAWAKAKGSPNPKNTWFKLMLEAVKDYPNDYLYLLWQNTMQSDAPQECREQKDVQESSESIVSAREYVSDTSPVTANDRDEILWESPKGEILTKTRTITEDMPQSSCVESLNPVSNKLSTGTGFFSLTQRLFLSVGVSLFVLLCICPPFSLYGFRNDTQYKIRYIGHQFYHSYQQGERPNFIEIDVLQFAILSSSIFVGTAGLILIFGHRGRHKD